jgi:hypothetical protein
LVGDFVAGAFVVFKWANVKVTVKKYSFVSFDLLALKLKLSNFQYNIIN